MYSEVLILPSDVESDLDLEKDDSDNESFGEDGDEESDFEEELAGKKPRKTKSRVQPPATSTRPGIKPRTSVTGMHKCN